MVQKQTLHNPHEVLVITPQILQFRPRNRLYLSVIECGEREIEFPNRNLAYSEFFMRDQKFTCPNCGQLAPHSLTRVYALDFAAESVTKLSEKINSLVENCCVSLISIDWYCDDLSNALNDPQLLWKIKNVYEFLQAKKWKRKQLSSNKDAAGQLRKQIRDFSLADLVSGEDQASGELTAGQNQKNAQCYQPIIVAHLSDYEHWIELKYVAAKLEKIHCDRVGKNVAFPVQSLIEHQENLWGYALLEQESVVRDFIAQGAISLAANNQMVEKRIATPKIQKLVAQAVQEVQAVGQENKSGKVQWDRVLRAKKCTVLARDAKNLKDIAALLHSVEHVEVRDAIILYAICADLHNIAEIKQGESERYLQQACNSAPYIWRVEQVIKKINAIAKYSLPNQAALYACIAYLWWWNDCSAAAFENAQYALKADPDYSLAKLIEKVILAKVPPPWWKVFEQQLVE